MEEEIVKIRADVLNDLGIPTFEKDNKSIQFKTDKLFEFKLFHLDKEIIGTLTRKDLEAFAFLVRSLAAMVNEAYPHFKTKFDKEETRIKDKYKEILEQSELTNKPEVYDQKKYEMYLEIFEWIKKYLGDRKCLKIEVEDLQVV